jgi:hypothetical protein
VKTAEYFSLGEQKVRLGRKDIDTTTHACEDHLPITITASEVPLKPVLNGLRK